MARQFSGSNLQEMAALSGDPYADETYRWWHLSTPPPELVEAVATGWLAPPARVLDLGCGLATEDASLAGLGFGTVGVDLSAVALRFAVAAHPLHFARASVTSLPFAPASFTAAIDRGCLHYLAPAGRGAYAAEVGRVLASGGRLLLRACLRAAGRRNDVSRHPARSLRRLALAPRRAYDDSQRYARDARAGSLAGAAIGRRRTRFPYTGAADLAADEETR